MHTRLSGSRCLTAASRASCGDSAASSLGGGCRLPTAPAAVARGRRGQRALRCIIDAGMLLGCDRAIAELCNAILSTCDIANGRAGRVWAAQCGSNG